MADVPQPILDRFDHLAQTLARLKEKQRLRRQQIIALIKAVKRRGRDIADVDAELRGLRYAIDVLDGSLLVIDDIPTYEVVSAAVSAAENWGAAEQAAAEEPPPGFGPLRFYATPERRKEALRRCLAQWSDRSHLAFPRHRIAADSGLGEALDVALAEGVAGGWLSQEGDSYRWADTESDDTETPAEVEAEPAAVAVSSERMEIVYQTIVRHAGEPTEVIKSALLNGGGFDSGREIGAYLSVLSRIKRIERAGPGWRPTETR